jgi:hypothetical protein
MATHGPPACPAACAVQPPELLVDGLLTPAADVYSFGVVLWEMYSGRRAWKGLNAAQIMHGVTSGARRLEPPQDAPPALQVGPEQPVGKLLVESGTAWRDIRRVLLASLHRHGCLFGYGLAKALRPIGAFCPTVLWPTAASACFNSL